MWVVGDWESRSGETLSRALRMCGGLQRLHMTSQSRWAASVTLTMHLSMWQPHVVGSRTARPGSVLTSSGQRSYHHHADPYPDLFSSVLAAVKTFLHSLAHLALFLRGEGAVRRCDKPPVRSQSVVP